MKKLVCTFAMFVAAGCAESDTPESISFGLDDDPACATTYERMSIDDLVATNLDDLFGNGNDRYDPGTPPTGTNHRNDQAGPGPRPGAQPDAPSDGDASSDSERNDSSISASEKVRRWEHMTVPNDGMVSNGAADAPQQAAPGRMVSPKTTLSINNGFSYGHIEVGHDIVAATTDDGRGLLVGWVREQGETIMELVDPCFTGSIVGVSGTTVLVSDGPEQIYRFEF